MFIICSNSSCGSFEEATDSENSLRAMACLMVKALMKINGKRSADAHGLF